MADSVDRNNIRPDAIPRARSEASHIEDDPPDANPAGQAPHAGAGGQAHSRAPSTIADIPRPPDGHVDNAPVFMNTRCDPCIDRGRTSRCNKAWPSCSKCIAEGTQEFCFEGAQRLAEEAAARVPRIPSRSASIASRRTPIPPRSLRSASRAPTNEPRRSGSPGRDPRPLREERTKSPRPHPPHSPTPAAAPGPDNNDRVRTLTLALARAQAALAQAELDAATAPIHAPPEAPAPQILGNILIPALHAGGTTTSRTRPPVIPGLLIGASFSSIPDAIWKLIGPSGWVTYIPLTYFMDEFVLDIDEHHKLEEAYHMTPNGKWVRTGGDKLPDRDEAGMQPTAWFRAWQRFLGVLTSIGHPDLERWRAHVTLIMAQPTFTSEWPLWLSYCITLRRRSLREGVDPSILQVHILNALRPDYERARAKTFMLSELARRSSAPDLARNRSLAPAHTPLPPRPISTTPAQHSPLTRTPQPTRAKPAVGKCFICASTAHRSLECAATATAAGGKLRIERVPDSNDWTLDDRAAIHTRAPCVDQPTMRPNLANDDPRRIVTPLLPDAWESTMHDAGILPEFRDVPTGLRNGFSLGVSSILSKSSISRNHSSALDNPLVIENHIATESAAGRYSSPFSADELTAKIGFFRTSPLGVVSKSSAPGSFRVIQDFSFPRPPSPIMSVNAEIDTDLFKCTWGFFPDVIRTLLSLPASSQAATFDVDAAYRRMPICPADQPHIVVGWNGKLWVDHCVPFGAASSNGIFGRCGDAIAELFRLRAMGPVLKWVDDFLFFRSPRPSPANTPATFTYCEKDIYELARLLGWPWKEAKTRLFNNIFRYLGFDWNIAQMYVSIPLEKRAKFLQKIDAWLAHPNATLKDTESLLGSLIHCALAIPEGRSRVVGLARFTSTFSHTEADRFVTRTRTLRASDDVRWWATRLRQDECGSFIRAPPPQWGTPCFMDASTSYGIGVIIGAHYGMWQLSSGWVGCGRDIGWAEIVAIELAILLVINTGLRDASITFRSDNQGVIGAIKAGRSRNDQQNLVLQRIVEHTAKHNLHLDIDYIATDDNPADAPSRGRHPPGLSPFPSLPPLDDALSKFLTPRT